MIELAEKDRYFYSILPLCPAEKILASSIDTRNTDSLDDSMNDLGDYFSESDSDSIHLNEMLEEEEIGWQKLKFWRALPGC